MKRPSFFPPSPILPTVVLAASILSETVFAASVDRVLSNVEQELKAAQEELAETREEIALDRAEAHRTLSLSASKVDLQQQEAAELTRQLDQLEQSEVNARSVALQLQSEIEQVVQILEDFRADFESHIHVAELRPHREREAKAIRASAEETIGEQVTPMLDQLTETVDRIERVIGGTIYESSVLTPDERIESGTVAQLGPLAFFKSASSSMSGTVVQHLSVYEPALIPAAKSDWPAIATLMENKEAIVPIDPSGIRISNAASSGNGWWDHIRQGGPVMIPILGLAVLATLIALVKMGQLARLGTRTPEDLSALVEALNQHQSQKAESFANRVSPPLADLIRYGIEHHQRSRLLLEELLEERIFVIKAKLERALPWIAVTAASAPLLGLLGTVTGMIDTFGLIAAYGSGDPKLLSSGISEALITTKFGLGMAIPAMLVHAFLNRKVKRIVVAMEQTAWRFVNELHTQRGSAFSEDQAS